MSITRRATNIGFLCILGVVPSIVLAQDNGGETTLALVDGGRAASGVEVVVSTAEGRQSVGITNAVGSLPFPASLLTGKVSAEIYRVDCDTGTTVLIVPDGAGLNAQDRACRDEEDPEDSCRCRRLGLFYWPFGTVAMGGRGGFPTRWVALGGGIGAGALTGVALSGGEEASSTSPALTPSSAGATPTATTPPPSPTPTTPSTPTPSSSGTYPTSFQVIQDRAGHVCCIPMPPNMDLQITAEGSTIRLEGPDPFVPVTGPYQPAGLRLSGRYDVRAGTFNATGSGTVAGFSGVRVELEGQISADGRLTGTYAMGTAGRLPQGEPIVYQLRGQKR